MTLRINLKLKLSSLYSSLFNIRFSLIFQKNIGVGGGTEKSRDFNHDVENMRQSCAKMQNKGQAILANSLKAVEKQNLFIKQRLHFSLSNQSR